MTEVRTRSFTLRLAPEDQTALAALCDRYGLDRSTSVRRAIRQALGPPGLRRDGCFTPVPCRPGAPGFIVHLERSENYG
jgi:hypothetical protein